MVARYWPLGAGRIITSPYGPRGGSFHAGVDFGRDGGSGGMPVYAVQAGTVIHAGAAQGYGGPDPAGWLVIDSTDAQGGGCLEYGHLIREVSAGQTVTAGQRIGRINPNSATNGGVAPHLHLSDMPREYNPAAKQDPMRRLAGALEPEAKEPTPVTDTLYADVSEWQVPVDDRYPHPVLCIRSNDGTYRDKKWATNYPWCKRAVDDGRLEFFIVYFVWRPNWLDAVNTLKAQIGEPHPRMAVMIDVESWGGQITGNRSDGINRAYWAIADWLGDRRRVIGYGNTGDLNALWPTKPDGIRLVVAGYGRLPTYPGMVAHQYTDGQGYGGGLPEGSPPFGNCDMNSANGLTPAAFAAACGIGPRNTGPSNPPTTTPGGTIMGDPQAIADEIMGVNDPANHHDVVIGEGGPNPSTVRTLQAKATAAAREVTLWLKRRPLAELISKRGETDTTLGHAIDAASYGDINYRILVKIADELDVDISDIK
ncbi:peptidoglycan DD-metalloendopeptidase family protein [Mycolicibacterium mageritense]|uniref:peptidoglycan DD-metalloendopeptidase family protein n=1 Tax=Mycolicibacterium mageritense TaxID=53462 RepID=UPI001E3D785D|nr:peptidoglycan DD-metalloendopeptidase family protein [Mycolicibacterium mageritense]MCC9182554.1 peptidoglycan DD-metalloendopeptidase family protein [Mycolicibacterium mageritense]